jgi:hypothetical protein
LPLPQVNTTAFLGLVPKTRHQPYPLTYNHPRMANNPLFPKPLAVMRRALGSPVTRDNPSRDNPVVQTSRRTLRVPESRLYPRTVSRAQQTGSAKKSHRTAVSGAEIRGSHSASTHSKPASPSNAMVPSPVSSLRRTDHEALYRRLIGHSAEVLYLSSQSLPLSAKRQPEVFRGTT